MAQILQPTSSNLDHIAGLLLAGEIVAVPTETVYGLAGNALNPVAVAKIYQAKGRPAKNPLIIHVGSLEQLADIAEFPKAGEKLAAAFWPGPLTMVMKKRPLVPDEVTAGLNTVAIRMPSHTVFKELAARCPCPLAAPSANPYGYVSPTRATHVEKQLGGKIAWILDGGPCEGGIESTIVSLIDPQEPALLRHGSLSIDELSEVLGVQVSDKVTVAESTTEGLISPGLMKKHYSPHTPIELFEGTAPTPQNHEAILFLAETGKPALHNFSLSQNGSLTEAAKNLYDYLQTLDEKQYQKIYLELPTAEGIGVALRDRMKRAAAE